MRKRLGLAKRGLAAFLCCSGFSFAAVAECLRYEPASVDLDGTISIKEAYGPPGYGEDPAHDSKEHYPVLALDAPICVTGYLDDGLNSESEGDLTQLQMVFLDRRLPRDMIGKSVTVSGSLFHSITGHHHTPVLIKVSDVKKTE